MRGSFARQNGVTKLEVVVVVILIAMLSGWLLHTLRFYEELTEKTVVESTIINIRSALRMKVAEMILQGEGDRQSRLAKTNPVHLLQQNPKGYMGELRRPANLLPGSWYYEQEKAELVYIPNLTENLRQPAETGQASGTRPVFRWQVRMMPAGEAGVVAVDIELLTPYEWF